MVKKIPGEIWKPLQFAGWKDMRKQYAISNLGRACSFAESLTDDGQLLNGSITTGYRTLNLHRPGNKGTIYIHREVARLFHAKPSPKHRFVIHVNHNKLDNSAKNLRWATLEEMSAHQQLSPDKIAYKQRQKDKAAHSKGLKLTVSQVRRIKQTLSDPHRKYTYRQLADKYGVSEMTLYRIRSGENWSGVQ
jgi:hypothetical protein